MFFNFLKGWYIVTFGRKCIWLSYKTGKITLPVYYIYSYTVKIAYFFGTLTIVTVTASAALNGTLDIIYFGLLI